MKHIDHPTMRCQLIGLMLLLLAMLLLTPAAHSRDAEPVDEEFTTDIRILLEDSHDQSRVPGPQYNFGQTYFHEMLVKTGATVETTTGVQGRARQPLSLEFLKRYQLVISHGKYNTGPTITHPFLAEEIEAVGDFVARGGFFMVISGLIGLNDNPQFYNPLLKQFGIAVSNDPSPGKVATLRDMEDPLIRAVPFIYPIWGGTLELSNRSARVLGSIDKKPVLATVPYGDGEVIAFAGGSSWLNQGFTPRATDSDAQKRVLEDKTRLMTNVLRWIDFMHHHAVKGK